MLYLIAILAFLFAAFRELSEHAKEGAFKTLPDWWNTPKSAQNKYDWNGKLPSKQKWAIAASPRVELENKQAVELSKDWFTDNL